MGGRRYLFCSEPCRWIFEQEKSRFADHKSVVDRIVAGEAPGKLTDLHTWMGLQAPVETGKDLRRGLDPWRLDPVPKRLGRNDARLPVRFRQRRLPGPGHRHPRRAHRGADGRTAVGLALAPERGGSITVRNEAGDILDPAATIAQAGLGNGDIFKVERR